jgi:putative ABC transport system permease protein
VINGMINLFKIAFRNVFRNFSRSMLTVFITAISVTFLIFCSSFLDGAITTFLNESIKLTGHLRIAAPNYDMYQKMLSLNHNVANYSQIKQAIQQQPSINQRVKVITNLIQFGAVVFNGDDNQESVGFGIEANYDKVLGLSTSIYQGRMMKPTADNEIIIGRRLAESLKIKINSTITILSRTLYNSIFLSNYKVVGIYDVQNGRLNKGFYLPLAVTQQMLDMEGKVTEVLIFGTTIADTAFLQNNLKKMPVAKNLELKQWQAIGTAPSFLGLVNIIAKIILVIIVILAGFGITNTTLMAILERRKEIGLLKSLGMQEKEIVTLFTIEGLILGLSGTVLGLVLGGSAAYYLAFRGVHFGSALAGIPFTTTEMVYGSLDNAIFIRAILLSIAACLFASLFPSIRGVRVNPAEALK